MFPCIEIFWIEVSITTCVCKTEDYIFYITLDIQITSDNATFYVFYLPIKTLILLVFDLREYSWKTLTVKQKKCLFVHILE